MQLDTSRQLDERFFHSCQGLKSRSSLVRLASVFDLLHIADEWAALDPGSVAGRLQEIVDVLITFIHSCPGRSSSTVDLPKAEVARRLGIGRTTLYKYLTEGSC
ncbi:helix-turn-helix domain-containing protein [Corynebacterium afermentans]|uniref:helix-turn-helix domain-containing protein n=1 Tax=Corynebacterium afermentans TaxID=38286 RepID=UPI0030B85F42